MCVIFVGHIQNVLGSMMGLQSLVGDLNGTDLGMFHVSIGGSNIANVQARNPLGK